MFKVIEVTLSYLIKAKIYNVKGQLFSLLLFINLILGISIHILDQDDFTELNFEKWLHQIKESKMSEYLV